MLAPPAFLDLTRFVPGAGIWAILLVPALITLAVHLRRRYRAVEGELAEARREVALHEARLDSLREQLQPDFLFGTLRAISALMRRDVEAADRALSRLSELLQLSIERSPSREVALRDELEFVERYLDVEQVRLGGRLRVRLLATPETLDAQVPFRLLQPLVENAIRHGLAGREEGRVEVVARRDREFLRLDVSDDGAGPPPGGIREGRGFAHSRRRLAQLYGASQEIVLMTGGEGTRVRVTLPFRRTAEVAA